MLFRRTESTIQALETKVSSGKDIKIEDFLALIHKDLYEDLKDYSKDKNGYEMLPVANEDEFVKHMLFVTRSMGRVFQNNRDCFQEDRKKERWEKANDKLKELQDIAVQEEINLQAHEQILKDIDAQERDIEDKLAQIGNLNILREQKMNKIRELRDLERESKTIRDDIVRLKDQIQGDCDNLDIQKKIKADLEDKSREALQALDQEKSACDDLIRIVKNTQREVNQLLEDRNKIRQSIRDLNQSYQTEKDNLLKEEDTYETRKQETEEEIRRKKDELALLESNLQSLNKECSDLNMEILKERTSATNAINQRAALERDLERVRDDNKDIIQRHKSSVNELEILQDENDKLSSECDKNYNRKITLQEEISRWKKQIESDADKMKELEDNNRKVKSMFDESEFKLREERSRYVSLKMQTSVKLRNHQAQIQAYAKEQKWISEEIRNLLGDPLMNSEQYQWMYAIDQNLVDALKKKEEAISGEMKDELSKITALLKALECEV